MKYIFFFFFSLCLSATAGAEDASRARKAEAAILNAAIGDVLGRVTEFIDTTSKIYKTFGPQGVIDLSQATIKHPVTQKTIAPYTDDTVMSLIVLEAMLDGRQKQYSVQNILDSLAHSFAELFSHKKYTIDPLYNLRAHGLRNIKAGSELNQLIQHNKDCTGGWWHNRPEKNIAIEAGCGSVMRAWPIGLIFADTLPLAIKLADEQSKITHRHPMARAASVAMAVGIAYAYQGKSVEEAVKAMIEAAEQFDAEELTYKKNAKKFSKTIELTATMIARDELLTSDMIRYAYQVAQTGKMPHQILGIDNKQINYRSPRGFLLGWAADEAISAAVYLFARHSDNPQQAIIEGVNTPGDSDSIASLAGALVGARTGMLYREFSSLHLLENKDYLCKVSWLV